MLQNCCLMGGGCGHCISSTVKIFEPPWRTSCMQVTDRVWMPPPQDFEHTTKSVTFHLDKKHRYVHNSIYLYLTLAKTNFHKIGKNRPKKSRFFQLEVVRFAGKCPNNKPGNSKTGWRFVSSPGGTGKVVAGADQDFRTLKASTVDRRHWDLADLLWANDLGLLGPAQAGLGALGPTGVPPLVTLVWPAGFIQVWSLTHFYAVNLLQSRIIMDTYVCFLDQGLGSLLECWAKRSIPDWGIWQSL